MMPLPFRLALRELRGGLAGFRIFLACLALGVAAIAGVGSVRSAIEAGLEREGAALLGGDAAVEFTYRFADDAETEWMHETATRLSATVDFRSMIAVTRDGKTDRALTQIRAVDGAYPLVGAVQLTPDMPLDQALAGDGTHPGAVIEPALADRLGLTPGDVIQLGGQEFILSALLQRYPDNAGGGFTLGPRTIVLTDDLGQSGLLAPGTLFSTEYRLDLPDGADLDALRNTATERFTGLRWRDARAGAPGIATFVERLGAFLVLVGLAGLAVGGVGISAAVRAYLAGKTETIATLKTLGAGQSTVFQTYLLQIGALTLVGLLIGLALGAVVPIWFGPLIEARLPVPAVFTLYPKPLVEAALYGALAALIFTLWPLARAADTRAAALFRGADQGRTLPALRYLLITAGLVAALLGLAVAFSGAVMLTLWTFGGIVTALALLTLAAQLTRALARRSGRIARGRPTLRAALGAIGARGGETTSVVLSLGLGLAVLAAVGQIDGTLRRAVQADLPKIAPSYFIVDIQPNQIDGFRNQLAQNPAVSRVDAAPMLRGIITQINGKPAADVAGGHWVIEGDRGVTYAATSPKGTTLTAGEWWPKDYTGPPQISFAAEEAHEMGLTIGDMITVNILGRDITARLTSLREVNFGTAGIGFVMAMNPSALRGAPHSWIATIYADQKAEADIVRNLADAYPNITAIRVRDGINRVSEIMRGIATATRYGAAATLLTGFLVLIGATLAGERMRTYEAAVMKTIGATRGQILRSFALRAALTGLAAGAVALLAGVAGGWAVARFVLDVDYTVIWPNAVMIIIGGVLATSLTGLVFALRPLSARPARILRAQE